MDSKKTMRQLKVIIHNLKNANSFSGSGIIMRLGFHGADIFREQITQRTGGISYDHSK
jgi:hypothetical protein